MHPTLCYAPDLSRLSSDPPEQIPSNSPHQEGLPLSLCVTICRTEEGDVPRSWTGYVGPRYLNTLTKLASNLSRLGESNPRPTHYEKPGTPLQAHYLHR